MYDSSKWKPSSRCRIRSHYRSVSTNKWELPIPLSKSYWDKVCLESEAKFKKVREPFIQFPINPSNVSPSHINNLIEFKHSVEPIVKVSPPSPLHTISSRDNGKRLVTRNFGNDNGDGQGDSVKNDKINSLSKNDPKLSQISNLITDFLVNSKVYPAKTCPYHKNEPPLKIFDDNLKNVLPKRKVSVSKLDSPQLHNGELNLLKVKAKKSCAHHVAVEFDDRNEKIAKRPKTAGTRSLSKIQVIESNLNSVLKIPKLEEMERERNVQSSTEINSIGVRKIEERLESFSRRQEVKELKVPKLGTVSLYPSFNRAMSIENLDEVYKCSNENKRPLEFPKIADASTSPEDTAASLSKPENRTDERKDLLKVPKLSGASSYPSFNKLSLADSVDKEDGQRIPINDPGRGYERTGKRSQDFLKVPKFSTLSSYPSFSSLVTDSFDNEDNSVFSSQTPSITAPSNVFKSPDDKSEINFEKGESNKLPDNMKLTKKYSLKHSVRYAYRALKFLTPNKKLDFTPKTHDSLGKSMSTSTHSSSSSTTSESKSTSIRRKKRVSDSSLDFGTVHSKLREKSHTYLDDCFLNRHSKFSEKTESVTIITTTRTTSGSSPKFVEATVVDEFSKILKKIPEIRMYPRKNKDRCLACLYKTFEEPLKVKEELPLTVIKSILEKPKLQISESESSSVSLPDLDTTRKLESEYEEGNSFDQSKGIDASHLSSPAQSVLSRNMTEPTKSSLRILENHFRQTASQSLSPQASQISKPTSNSLSVSSEHSKASSVSGQSSDSDDTQIPTDQKLSSYKYFVSCHAPLNLRPSLEPLKALRFKTPMSMHSRSASVAKSIDETDREESTDDSVDAKKKTKRNFITKGSRKIIDSSEEEDSIKSTSRSTTRNYENSLKSRESLEIVQTDNELTESGTIDAVEVELEKMNESSLEKGKRLMKMKSVSGNILKLTSFDDSRFFKSMDERKSHKLTQSQSAISLQLNSTKSYKESDSQISRNDLEILSESKTNVEKSAIERLSLVLGNDLIKRLEKSISDNDTALEMLKVLTTEYLDSISNDKKCSINEDVEKSNTIAKNLLKLLVESKQYLHPDKFPSNIEFSSKQPLLCNSRQLKRNLPPKSYDLVAPILGFDKSYHKKPTTETKESGKIGLSESRATLRKSSETTFDLIVHPPSVRLSQLSVSSENADYLQLSPYALFLKKPRRKAITWRPLKEKDLKGYDPEATLNMRAKKITNKICEDFCRWLRGLGGNNERIDEEVLRDMFQIDFLADACRTIQVKINEMPMIPKVVAITRSNLDAGELELIRQHLIRDSRAEKKSRRTIGFGTTLPKELQIIPPKNQVAAKWLKCDNVPKDLETMSAVWKGITHVDSVKGFKHWMKTHRNIPLPKILKNASTAVQPEARHSEVDGYAHMELSLAHIKSLKVIDIDTENSHDK